MKICLIYPLISREPKKKYELPFPPLGIAYLAASLRRAGHTIKILDRNIYLVRCNYDFDLLDSTIINIIRDLEPRVIGFSASTPLMYDVQHFSSLAKKVFPDKILAVGGPHPTVEPEESLKECAAIDVVVKGEGELTVLELLNNLSRLGGVKGISYRSNGSIFSNPDRELIHNLDFLPFPARDLLDMEFYCQPMFARGIQMHFTTIFTARGCPYRCHFCAGPQIFQGKVRFNSASYVIAEIEHVIKNFKVDILYFAEDEFLSDKKRALEICEALIKKRINRKVWWIAQIRPDPKNINLSLLKVLKKAGCIQIEYGFESGSQEELERMNKRTDVGKYYNVAELTKKAGIRYQANLILKYPGQTEKDFQLTRKFIEDIKPDFIQTNMFWPLPGTQAYKDLITKGYKISWEDTEINTMNFTQIDDKHFKELFKDFFYNVIKPLHRKSSKRFYLLHSPIFLLRKIFR